MKKKDKISFAIATVVVLLLMIVFSMKMQKSSFTIVIIALLLAYVVFDVCLMSKYIKQTKKDKKSKLDKFGATLVGTLKHASGLPISNGVFIDVYYCPDKFVFKKGGQEFIISREKITSVDVVTGKNIKSQQISGAATGKYLLGGTTGAVIGALAATTTYLAISYVSDGKSKSVLLDTASSGTFALKVQKDFANTSVTKHTTVEL
jgi:Ca2+/Na+ antiporter